MPQSDLRQAYEAAVAALGDEVAAMLADGASEEQAARLAVARRNLLKQQWRDHTPPEVLARIEARSLAQYGHVLGPTVEQLRAAGKSWREILRSAAKPGGGPGHW
ncbi:hypothetical protein RD110_25035 [Rhodoferax koreense]|uniref:Hemagglutinin n=1 Tax=Rhodoferax koreensis TaxID=1842727 RepID=A0A1P8K222_9BURK|nr:hypothetical protein [Rhodoferax koreense]APW40064.1 hypothetical protein RD110_25035 [Rhodoferax koreense]